MFVARKRAVSSIGHGSLKPSAENLGTQPSRPNTHDLPKSACDKKKFGPLGLRDARIKSRGRYSARPLAMEAFARRIAARTKSRGSLVCTVISCNSVLGRLCIGQQTRSLTENLFILLLGLPTSSTPERQHRLQKSRVSIKSQACLCLFVRQENWPLLAVQSAKQQHVEAEPDDRRQALTCHRF